ncbi:hypothetical protein ACIA8R_08830 [Nonomuraea sp. NPDC051191]|uniref:hypothetical protein n=1 Tax=Nonomuraea sp. NPDC051191 TaxID=3364372 RepID=UPI0037B77179
MALLQAVTFVAWGGDEQVSTADGVSTLHEGESVSWSVACDSDAGPDRAAVGHRFGWLGP